MNFGITLSRGRDAIEATVRQLMAALAPSAVGASRLLKAKSAGQPVDSGPCGRVRRVAVDVAGNADRAVPEQIGNRLDVHASLKPRHGRAVPQGCATPTTVIKTPQ